MQRRRQTKRLINGQKMSFARAMQNFVDFNLLLRNNKKKTYMCKSKELGEHSLSALRWMDLSNFYIRRKNWIES